MLRPRSTALFHIRLFALAAICVGSTAHADDYVDVDQMRKAKNYIAALSKANSYLATKPGDPQMRFLKGLVQRDSGKTTEAVTTFTKLTEDYPELPEPYNNLAVIYAEQNQFDKAQALLERAIRTHPSYATAHENLGDIHARLADQAYRAALQLDGASPDVRPKLALLGEIFSPTSKGGKNVGTLVASASPPAASTRPATPAVPPAPVKPSVPAQAALPAPGSVAPAPAPAVAVAVAVAPVPDKPVAVSDNAANDIKAAVELWAKAWASQNVAGYLEAYDKKFDPPGNKSRSVWEQERRDRIVGKANISVRIDGLTVKVKGNDATAQFRQDYKAGALAVKSRKTLEMTKTGDRWFIVKELSGS